MRPVAARLAGAMLPLRIATPGCIGAILVDTGGFTEHDLSPFVSAGERDRAAAIVNGSVRMEFLLRRSFQRLFVRDTIAWEGPTCTIPMRQDPELRPYCFAAPEVWFSFSSSGSVALAAACKGGQAGIDVEKRRQVAHLDNLARRFLCPSEAERLGRVPKDRRDRDFLKLWTIKEACLKAAGHGISFGLDKFEVTRRGAGHRVNPPPEFGGETRWTIEALKMPSGYIASLARFARDSSE